MIAAMICYNMGYCGFAIVIKMDAHEAAITSRRVE